MLKEGWRVKEVGNSSREGVPVFESTDWNEQSGVLPFSAFIFLCLSITCSGGVM